MSIIELSRKEMTGDKNQDKFFDIEKVKIGLLENFLIKVAPKEISSMVIWKEIMNFSNCWAVKFEVLEELEKGFDMNKLKITKKIDVFTLADSFYLCKPF